MPPVLKTTSTEDDDMAKVKNLKRNVKGVLNQRVRLGLFSVPLWVAGAVYAAKLIRDRRRQHVTV
jgi:ABC-type uncharacterized transport system permease subunit